MGYLIGFLFASFFAGYLNFNKNIFVIFGKLIFSVSLIYILGAIWLGTLIGWDKPILQLGVTPFLLAELFKICLLTMLAKKIIPVPSFEMVIKSKPAGEIGGDSFDVIQTDDNYYIYVGDAT